MSTFTCEVVQIKLEPHPDADRIEIAHVGLFKSIVQKGQFQDGDKAVYIPEGAVLPEDLLREMNLWDETKNPQMGKLAGSHGNRVKPIRLRGIVSQGLLYPLQRHHVRDLGADLAEVLGITKYQPKIPASFQGTVAGVRYGLPHWDVENLKKTPHVLQEGVHFIRVTEKLHGTFCCIGAFPQGTVDNPENFYRGMGFTASKGFYNRGQVFNPNLDKSLYTSVALRTKLLDAVVNRVCFTERAVLIFGEIFGEGIQDLGYGLKEPTFRQFLELTQTSNGLWMKTEHTFGCSVPVLYSGFYKGFQHLKDLAEAPSSFGEKLIREGVVVEIEPETRHFQYPYKIVSDRYLLRKGEQTEFE